jgi:integrase-like protein
MVACPADGQPESRDDDGVSDFGLVNGSLCLYVEGDFAFCRAGSSSTMRLAAKRANVKQRVHILRHTFCSHLSMRGAPARAIQELAGHADLTMTQRYMHLSPAALDAAIQLLDRPGCSQKCGRSGAGIAGEWTGDNTSPPSRYALRRTTFAWSVSSLACQP